MSAKKFVGCRARIACGPAGAHDDAERAYCNLPFKDTQCITHAICSSYDWKLCGVQTRYFERSNGLFCSHNSLCAPISLLDVSVCAESDRSTRSHTVAHSRPDYSLSTLVRRACVCVCPIRQEHSHIWLAHFGTT